MAKNRIEELETALLDQIEKLNDDALCAGTEESAQLVERSRAMYELAGTYIDIQRAKNEEKRLMIDAVRLCANEGVGLKFEKVLGLEAK